MANTTTTTTVNSTEDTESDDSSYESEGDELDPFDEYERLIYGVDVPQEEVDPEDCDSEIEEELEELCRED